MNKIETLSETKSRSRAIRLNAPAEIPPAPDRPACERHIAAFSTDGAPAGQPSDLALAIRHEVQAGHGADAAERAARKYPHLASAWAERFAAARS